MIACSSRAIAQRRVAKARRQQDQEEANPKDVLHYQGSSRPIANAAWYRLQPSN